MYPQPKDDTFPDTMPLGTGWPEANDASAATATATAENFPAQQAEAAETEADLVAASGSAVAAAPRQTAPTKLSSGGASTEPALVRRGMLT